MAADSGMDTCPSPEIADSRKRPRDGDTENGDIKRSHFSSVQDLVTALPVANGHGNNIAPHFGGEGTFHFKLLVPSMAAGAIIGKGGETIAQLQKETGARVKMSKSHDFYPGTSERVCMITGSVDAIMAVLDFIMDKIKEKPDFAKPFLIEPEGKAPMEREKQVKILVPNSTAGMIIGKGGNFIKLIKEASGSYVQISQKATDITLQERCITVLGEKEANKKACMMILSKVVDDPQSGSCPNISYGDVAGPVANYNPKGSPYTYNQQAHGFGAAGGPVLAVNGVGGAVSSAAAAAALGAFNLTLNMAAPNAAATPVSQQIIETIKVSLRNAGYSETACTEICTALSMLSKNGVLGLGLSPAIPALPPASLSAAYFPLSADQPAVYGPIGQVSLAGSTSPSARGSLERFADAAFEAAFRPPAVAPISLGGGAFGLGVGAAAGGGAGAAATLLPLSKSPTPGEVGGVKDSKNVEIAEVIVGAILGPGGRSLIEIQHMSGANIQISKKGTFAPGTRNRIVTITGSPTAISSAQYLIEQKINEEELKRTRHNAISGLMQ